MKYTCSDVIPGDEISDIEMVRTIRNAAIFPRIDAWLILTRNRRSKAGIVLRVAFHGHITITKSIENLKAAK
jgi:hypothetical protein